MVTIGSDLAGIQTWITSDEPSRPAEEKAEWRTEKTSTNGGPETTSSNRAGVHPLPSSKFPLRKADPLKSRAIRRPQVCRSAQRTRGLRGQGGARSVQERACCQAAPSTGGTPNPLRFSASLSSCSSSPTSCAEQRATLRSQAIKECHTEEAKGSGGR